MKTFFILLVICILQAAVDSSPRRFTYKNIREFFNRHERSLADDPVVDNTSDVDSVSDTDNALDTDSVPNVDNILHDDDVANNDNAPNNENIDEPIVENAQDSEIVPNAVDVLHVDIVPNTTNVPNIDSDPNVDNVSRDKAALNFDNAENAENAETDETANSDFEGFENFKEGLRKLQEALSDPDYDWQKKATEQQTDTVKEPGIESQSNENTQPILSGLRVLINVMKELVRSDSTTPPPTTTSPAPVSEKDLHHLQQAEEIFKNIIRAYSDPVAGIEYSRAAEAENNDQSLDDAVNHLVEALNKFYADNGITAEEQQNPPSIEPIEALQRSLALLERAKEIYLESFDGSSHLERMRAIINGLKSGSSAREEVHEDNDHIIVSGSVLPENIIPTPPPVIDLKGPCASPYVEIAYKMCILPELEERLVWSDAVDYCRSRGLELAFDSVVIKARRYFNGALGEQGTRERWPIWVGGKKYTDEDGQGDWKWVDGSRVPEFLWTEGKPRSFEGQDTPDGLCMIMDGYQAYNTDSLPCHNRRRFVCQRPDY